MLKLLLAGGAALAAATAANAETYAIQAGRLIVDAAFVETNPVPVKWVMVQLGLLPSGFAREPLSALSDAGRKRVAELLERSPHVTLPATALA